jgi:hypothetical protein
MSGMTIFLSRPFTEKLRYIEPNGPLRPINQRNREEFEVTARGLRRALVLEFPAGLRSGCVRIKAETLGQILFFRANPTAVLSMPRMTTACSMLSPGPPSNRRPRHSLWHPRHFQTGASLVSSLSIAPPGKIFFSLNSGSSIEFGTP